MARHLTLPERQFLHRLQDQGKSKAETAALLGRHRSTIYRELDRHTVRHAYRPHQAQRLSDERRRARRRPRKMDDPEVHAYVEERLEQRWSPEQIAGRSQRDYPQCEARRLSRQAIYNWIRDREPPWRSLLRRAGRQPEKRGKLLGRVSIRGRPEVINRRRRYGDWEGDTIVGKNRHSALVTLVERKSGYARIGCSSSMKSAAAMQAAKRCLRDLPPALRRSVTFDNGKEFAEHRRLTRSLGVKVYFAEPYASWQRGSNENLNGLLRQFFPKGVDFREIDRREAARVESLLNERPRKRYHYQTPAEILKRRLCRK